MGNLFLIKEPFPKDIWIKWCILYLHVSKCSPWVVTNLAIQVLKFSHSQLLLPKLFSKVMLNSVGAVSTVFPQTFVLPLSLFMKRWLFLLAASFQRFSLVSLPPVSCPFLQRAPFQIFFWPYFLVIALHMDLILASCSQLFNGACTELHIVSLADCILPGGSEVMNPLPMQEMQEIRVWSLGQEDPLKKEMATHSSILAREIPWTEEPGRLQSMELQRIGHDLAIKQQQQQLHPALFLYSVPWMFILTSPGMFLFSATVPWLFLPLDLLLKVFSILKV